MTGSEFAKTIMNKIGKERDDMIVSAILSGNVPSFVNERRKVGSIEIIPDYLAVGTDDDFLYCPMLIDGALRIAGAFGGSLPTAREVDDIYLSSEFQRNPNPLPYGPQMSSTEWFVKHNKAVQENACRVKSGVKDVVAGHKKDLVIPFKAGRITIYGWHQMNGKPIQPESGVHDSSWVDYSHGVRIVFR